MSTDNHSQYWAENIALIFKLGIVWAVVSFGAGILFVDVLDKIVVFGFPVGFWFANQGSIYSFILIILYYIGAMNKLDAKYNVDE